MLEVSQGRHFISSNFTGLAGEHLAVADLLKQNHLANLAGAGFPYDIVAEVNNVLYRVQVKSAARPHATRTRPVNEYSFKLSNKMSGHDIVAFVAVDIGVVAYVPTFKCSHHRMLFQAPGALNHKRRKGHNLDHYTLDQAIKDIHEHTKQSTPPATGKRQG